MENSKIASKDSHPFEAFIPPKSKAIIIGTIPPHRFCLPNKSLKGADVDFYYGSTDNDFWRLVKKVSSHDFEINKEGIKEHLTMCGIAVADTIKSCFRKNNSASDSDLYEIEFNDIGRILDENPSIKTLVYTSEMVKKHINQIFKAYHCYISKQDRKCCKLKVGSKEYSCFILYSPSPQALRGIEEAKRLEQYRQIFKTLESQ